jgi:hypothetical protein
MKHIHKNLLIGLFMLAGAIGFNLWIYRLEPTVQIDPNDNTFQYALVERTNHVWDYADSVCTGITKPFCVFSYLSDHWVPNWAQGYNLPYYYSHIPQIAIVSSYRLLQGAALQNMTLFTYYHWITYLLLSFFPLSLFIALLIIGVSPITAGFGALIATQLSTDGLYGLDPSSFLWRGYGLSSQLYAMIFLPVAIAYMYRIFQKNHTITFREYCIAILTLAATTAGHLGIGIIAFITAGIFAIAEPISFFLKSTGDISRSAIMDIVSSLRKNIIIAAILYSGVFILLGYWIIPILRDGNFHNTSFWDPIWKFDSYGFRPVLKNLFNGDLFDFGRFPILTGMVFAGILAAVTQTRNKNTTGNTYFPFGILFAFWLLMYFGKTTWGSVLYLIPGMSDFHMSRFIVGVHIIGMFLIPIGIEWLISHIRPARHASASVAGAVTFVVFVILVVLVYPQTIEYAKFNDTLILRAQSNFTAQNPEALNLEKILKDFMKTAPGRVFAGRGGSWGKSLKIAETPYYMNLSTYGIPTVLWLPETWSPNSDTEQYFRDTVPGDYKLYNIRYVVTPINLSKDQVQPFWVPLANSDSWALYGVNTTNEKNWTVASARTEGYITTGIRPAIVSVTKDTFLNVVRLWIQSDFHDKALYPELTFDKHYPVATGLPNFRMTDEANYQVPDGTWHNLFSEPPLYLPHGMTTKEQLENTDPKQYNNVTILSQRDDHDMQFTATVDVGAPCTDCMVILKQSFHPSWTATIDGKPVQTHIVFPFFIAVEVPPGRHTVVYSYQPSPFKLTLLLVALAGIAGCGYLFVSGRARLRK